jgi:hypothetical protein
MRSIITWSLLVAIAPLYWGVNIGRETPVEVPYPEGYRSWVHVRSGLIGPESPSYKTNGLGGL